MQMKPLLTVQRDPRRVVRDWLVVWWRIVHLGAQVMVLALSRAGWSADLRPRIAREVYLGTAPLLLWFTVLSSLISLVLIRIVVVTAASYGLSQYALQMLVRVLVLELIPLTAGVFVALRVALPDAAEVGQRVARLRDDGRWQLQRGAAPEFLQAEVLPRVLAAVFSVIALAALSGVVTLLLAYLSVYGFALGGLPAYTRTVGHVFHPVVTLVFVLKTLLLALAVALVPLGSALYDRPDDRPRRRSRASAEVQVLVRLFLVILLIEALSLAGNYY
jgi:phospholipid/cholesterol/gamma-HCH transport system permease protein